MLKSNITVVTLLIFVLGIGSLALGAEPSIQYSGQISIGKILKDISSKTGIKFIMSDEVSRQVIQAHVKADNWKSAVHQLLSEFSTLESWNENLASSKVWVYGKEFAGNSETIQIKQRTPPRHVVTTAPKDNPLNQLPPHIRHDPEVLRFLYLKGVEMPADVKERYGDRLENLPPVRPMFLHVAKNVSFVRFLKSIGLRPPPG